MRTAIATIAAGERNDGYGKEETKSRVRKLRTY
jgi:hypothetical protein